MTLLIMAQGKSNNGNTSNNELNTTFHDFLGMSCASDSPMYFASKTVGFGTDVVRLSEASLAGSVSSGGGRPPISTTSDLGSERQVANHIEGVPFYGTRSDLSGPDISNRVLRSKRSNSDSAFMGSSRDGIPQMCPDSFENSHLMKMLRSGSGGERPRRSNDEEMFFSMQPMRPSSSSFMLQPPTGSRTDVNVSKWERSLPMNVGPAGQYPPRAGQFSSFMHQVPPNRFRDANANPSVISQVAAADEGSRTGIKGSGILTSINASSGVSERNPSALMPSSSRPMSGTHIPEPESSTTPRRRGLTSASQQMTIFYGGQAHVFDDVHPNKMRSGVSGETASFARTNIDWKETSTAHVFKADVPWLKKEEVKVVVDGRILQISGERSREEEEKKDTWHRVERSNGKFMRRFRLPKNTKMDQVKAAMENGVLTVTVAKGEEKKADVKSVQNSGLTPFMVTLQYCVSRLVNF